MRFLQSALFYTSYLLFSLAYMPLAVAGGLLVVLFLPCRGRQRLTRWLIRLYGNVTLWLAGPWIRFRVQNSSGIAPGAGCLFVANHQSLADPYLVALLGRECVFVSNHWPFRIPVLGLFARIAGYLDAQSLAPEELGRRIRQRLEDGVTLFGFPEGTRTRTGRLGAFHTTLFRIALAERIPIVPVCIAGVYGIIPHGSLLLRPGTVHIRALEALHPGDYESLSAHQLKNKVRRRIADELAMLEGGAPC